MLFPEIVSIMYCGGIHVAGIAASARIIYRQEEAARRSEQSPGSPTVAFTAGGYGQFRTHVGILKAQYREGNHKLTLDIVITDYVLVYVMYIVHAIVRSVVN